MSNPLVEIAKLENAINLKLNAFKHKQIEFNSKLAELDKKVKGSLMQLKSNMLGIDKVASCINDSNKAMSEIIGKIASLVFQKFGLGQFDFERFMRSLPNLNQITITKVHKEVDLKASNKIAFKQLTLGEEEKFFNEKAILAANDPSNWRTCSPDHPPCAVCKKPITRGVPLRAFNEESNTEIAFHVNCCYKDGRVEGFDDYDADDDLFVECLFCDQLQKCSHIDDEYKKVGEGTEVIRENRENQSRGGT